MHSYCNGMPFCIYIYVPIMLLQGECASCSRSRRLYIGYQRILLETESEMSVNRLHLLNLHPVDHHKPFFVGPLLSLDYVDK